MEEIINISNPMMTEKDWRTAKGKAFQELESYGDEQSLRGFDSFLSSFGI